MKSVLTVPSSFTTVRMVLRGIVDSCDSDVPFHLLGGNLVVHLTVNCHVGQGGIFLHDSLLDLLIEALINLPRITKELQLPRLRVYNEPDSTGKRLPLRLSRT